MGHPSPLRRGRNSAIAWAVDAALETTIAGSFSRMGYGLRRRTQQWSDPPRMDGRLVVVTGGSSGIGLAAVTALGRLGASLWVVGRNRDRTVAAARTAVAAGAPSADAAVLDVADGEALDRFASRVAARVGRLDGLVHCAGALLRKYSETSDGIERTVATHVLAPFRLTWRLESLLLAAEHACVAIVTSGGLYTERFDIAQLEQSSDHYDGVRAYARAKRAQVVLAHEWERRWSPSCSIDTCAVNPGWVDTPGLRASLPAFARLGRALRTPEQGADTTVWLVAGGARDDSMQPDHGPTRQPSKLWLDRRRRPEHYLPWTRSADPIADQEQLWDWCAERTGLRASPVDH